MEETGEISGGEAESGEFFGCWGTAGCGGAPGREESSAETVKPDWTAACRATISLRVSAPHQPASVYRRTVSSSAQRLRLLVGLPDGQCSLAGFATGSVAERGGTWGAADCDPIADCSGSRLTAHSLIEVKSKWRQREQNQSEAVFRRAAKRKTNPRIPAASSRIQEETP